MLCNSERYIYRPITYLYTCHCTMISMFGGGKIGKYPMQRERRRIYIYVIAGLPIQKISTCENNLYFASCYTFVSSRSAFLVDLYISIAGKSTYGCLSVHRPYAWIDFIRSVQKFDAVRRGYVLYKG